MRTVVLPANWPDRERAQRRLERHLARQAAREGVTAHGRGAAAQPAGTAGVGHAGPARGAARPEAARSILPQAEARATDGRLWPAGRLSEALTPLLEALAEAVAEAVARRLGQAVGRQEQGGWLTVQEAAQYARTGKGRIYVAIRSGELPARQVGRRLVIGRDELDAWLRGCGRVEHAGHVRAAGAEGREVVPLVAQANRAGVSDGGGLDVSSRGRVDGDDVGGAAGAGMAGLVAVRG